MGKISLVEFCVCGARLLRDPIFPSFRPLAALTPHPVPLNLRVRRRTCLQASSLGHLCKTIMLESSAGEKVTDDLTTRCGCFFFLHETPLRPGPKPAAALPLWSSSEGCYCSLRPCVIHARQSPSKPSMLRRRWTLHFFCAVPSACSFRPTTSVRDTCNCRHVAPSFRGAAALWGA